MVSPNIICLVRVRNEAWILDRFLKCASLWADYIIVADQLSEDGSKEIAGRYPKVLLIDNPSPTYSDSDRHELLINAARTIPGPRLLIALDADEILTSNFMDSREWDMVLHASAGTAIRFQRANLRPGFHSYWPEYGGYGFTFGYMDDGREYLGRTIHSERLPVNAQSPMIVLREIKVLHYQYTHWERMQSKHRWYQCWERINQPQRHAIDIYRQYHHMYDVPVDKIHPIPKEWLSGYEKRNIDMTSINRQESFWWDRQVLDWFEEYGVAKFRREAIWSVDWNTLARKINPDSRTQVDDPRNNFDKVIHSWLRDTQSTQTRFRVRMFQRMLRLVGW